MSEGPSVKNEEDESLAGQLEELKVKSEFSIQVVYKQNDHVEHILEEEGYHPVVAHLDTIYLHYIDQFLLFFEDHVEEEHWKAHAKGDRDQEYSEHVLSLSDEVWSVNAEWVIVDACYYCSVV